MTFANKTIKYNTRDGKGNDIVKNVVIKQHQICEVNFVCPICNKEKNKGCKIKDIVSDKFTDWAYVGPYICESCTDLFSLYFYNYVVDPEGIHLYNVRELSEQLQKLQKPPFLFVISTTQKKHLFYRAKWNNVSTPFAVNLETETIFTNPGRMRNLFAFVECLQTLKCSKEELKRGVIRFDAAIKINTKRALEYLNKELSSSREIQIPLYCGQRRNISEEEAVCIINSLLKK
nr:MAG TPA: hypothetical protein [Caudoviricetes sp.]